MSLYEDINNAVIKYLEEQLKEADAVNVPDMTREMVSALVDIVIEQPKENPAALLASINSDLGNLYLEKKGLLITKQ